MNIMLNAQIKNITNQILQIKLFASCIQDSDNILTTSPTVCLITFPSIRLIKEQRTLKVADNSLQELEFISLSEKFPFAVRPQKFTEYPPQAKKSLHQSKSEQIFWEKKAK